jgi:CIC family chloride channel protein
VVKPLVIRLLRLQVWLVETLRPSELQSTLFWAGIVGLLGGLSSVFFRRASSAFQWFLTQRSGDFVDVATDLPWWGRLLVPTAGGFLAGAVLYFGMRLTRGQSSTDYLEAISLGDGVIRSRPSLVKSISSLLSIASGGSIGREGSMSQLGAWLASLVGRNAKFTTPRLRLMVACGGAAGIAAAYNAPIAGALFVAEIVLGSIAMESFGPLIFASVVSTLTARILLGPKPIFAIPPFLLVSAWELIPYLILGAVAGTAAPAFLRLLRTSEDIFSNLKCPVYLRLALGGLVTGAISIFLPEAWGNGYSVVSSILQTEWLWQTLLAVLLCKVIATAAMFGSGAVGGVFTPTLFVGAALGCLFGMPVHHFWPEGTASPSAYALVGMGCLLAATTHAPLMAILILFEMTLDYEIILPLMLACVTSYYVSISFDRRSVYAESLKRKEPVEPMVPLSEMRVYSLMKPDPTSVPESARFSQIAQTFVGNRNNYLFVTSDGSQFSGAISLHDIKAYLNEAEISNLVTAFDLVHRDFPYVAQNATLTEALAKFSRHEGERLPVINDYEERKLIGSISKTDLLLTMAHGNTGPKQEETPVIAKAG